MAIIYGLKVNLSVAIVGMLNHTAIKMAAVVNDTHDVNKTLPVDPERAKVADGPFEWSSQIQGIILSCYFWGYLVSQMPGGRIAEILSAKWVMFFSVTINVICTLLTPVMAQAHYIAVIFMRVGEGIGGGVTFPAMHVLLSKWAPPAERSVLSTLVYAGTALGTVISMFMAGVLTDNLGWESVFYVMGGLSCIWCILWVILVQDSPQQQSIISVEERNMIVTSLGGTNDDRGHKKLPVPWHAVLRSKPFWAILVAHTCSNWGWYMLLIKLPSYMHDVLHLNMNEIAVATSLSFLCLWFFSMALSKTLDWLRGKEIITTTTARKTSTLIASVVPTVCLLAICFSGDSRGAPVALMAIAVTSYGGMFCGFLSNHIDIAPNYAGSLMAITNTVATIPGIVVPVFVGSFIDNKENDTILRTKWRIVFFVTIGLFIIEMVTYTLFGSGEQQSWNNVEEEKEDNSNETKPLNNEEREKANV